MSVSPEQGIVGWLNTLPQDSVGDGSLTLHAFEVDDYSKFLRDWRRTHTSSRMTRGEKGAVASNLVQRARQHGFLGEDLYKVKWSNLGSDHSCQFQIKEGVPMLKADTETKVCPDCKGTKQYVGLYAVTPCYTCQGQSA